MEITSFLVFNYFEVTIDTEIKAKRNNMISELIIFRIMKAKTKVKFGVKYLCGHECERSSVQLISMRKRKRNNILGNQFHFNFRVNGIFLRREVISKK